jgi:hypothetical protein
MSISEENEIVNFEMDPEFQEDLDYGGISVSPLTAAVGEVWQEAPPPKNGRGKERKSKIQYVGKSSKRVHTGASFVCLICNKTYKYEAFLTRHMVSKHRACEAIHQYSCMQCGAIFADEAGYEKHKASFYEFLNHHLQHVAPKQREKENELRGYEAFVNADGILELKEDMKTGEDEDIMLDNILKELEETTKENGIENV